MQLGATHRVVCAQLLAATLETQELDQEEQKAFSLGVWLKTRKPSAASTHAPPAPETSPRANRSCSRHPTSDPPQSAAAPPHHSSTPSLSSHLNQTLSSRALEHAATQHTILHRHARSQPVELSRRRGLTPLAQRAASREVGHLQADGSMAQNSGLQTKAEQLRDSLRQ
eukprot:scaffold30545_cov17-Tisochrysis_lutea.AAC.1